MPAGILPSLGLAGAALACALPSVCDAAVLYATGFEPPEFSPGLLTGQQGWLTTASVFSSQAAMVGTANPRSGSQSVAIDSTFIPQADWFFKPLNYAVGADSPIVRVSVDMYLAGTALDSGGWGIDCYDGAGVRVGEFFVNPNGLGSISDGVVAQPAVLVPHEHWNTLVFTLDYAQRLMSLGINGQAPIGSLAFNSAAGSTLGDADFHVFAAGTDTAYFDNFTIEAVPGPAGAALVGAAGMCAGLRQRRRM